MHAVALLSIPVLAILLGAPPVFADHAAYQARIGAYPGHHQSYRWHASAQPSNPHNRKPYSALQSFAPDLYRQHSGYRQDLYRNRPHARQHVYRSRPHAHIQKHHGQQKQRYGVADRIRLELDGRYLKAFNRDGRRVARLYLRHDERWQRKLGRVYVRGPHQLEAYSQQLDKRGRLFLRPRSKVQFGSSGIVVRYDRVEERYSLDLKLQSRRYL